MFEFEEGDSTSIGIEFALEDEEHTVFTKFYDDPARRLGSYPWNTVFKALGSDDTADLIDKKVEFEVKNNTKNDLTYTNIKKIRLIRITSEGRMLAYALSPRGGYFEYYYRRYTPIRLPSRPKHLSEHLQ